MTVTAIQRLLRSQSTTKQFLLVAASTRTIDIGTCTGVVRHEINRNNTHNSNNLAPRSAASSFALKRQQPFSSSSTIQNERMKDPVSALQGGSVSGHHHDRATSKPDSAAIYATEMALLAKQGKATEAETMLQQLVDAYEQTKDPRFAPSRDHYNSLMYAWFASGEKAAADKNEAILETMLSEAKERSDESILPNTDSFAFVFGAWKQSKDPLAADRAEAMLQRMHQLDRLGVEHVKPNLQTYMTVLDCIANSRSRDAVSMAETVLESMLTRFKAGDEHVQPDSGAFTSIISAFAKSRNRDIATKPGFVFDRMLTSGIKPDTNTFIALISTLTRNKDPTASVKAEGYFRDMKKLWEAGEATCQPNTAIYNAVITTWSTSKNPSAANRARALLDEMKQLAGDGQLECLPNVMTYNALLNVVARVDSQDKATLAFNILSEMDQQSIPPDDRTFGSVLMACAFSNNYERTIRGEAFKVAARVIQRAQAESNPSTQTFSFFFTAAEGLGHDKVVQLVYNWACAAGFEHDEWMLRSLKKAAPHLATHPL